MEHSNWVGIGRTFGAGAAVSTYPQPPTPHRNNPAPDRPDSPPGDPLDPAEDERRPREDEGDADDRRPGRSKARQRSE